MSLKRANSSKVSLRQTQGKCEIEHVSAAEYRKWPMTVASTHTSSPFRRVSTVSVILLTQSRVDKRHLVVAKATGRLVITTSLKTPCMASTYADYPTITRHRQSRECICPPEHRIPTPTQLSAHMLPKDHGPYYIRAPLSGQQLRSIMHPAVTVAARYSWKLLLSNLLGSDINRQPLRMIFFGTSRSKTFINIPVSVVSEISIRCDIINSGTQEQPVLALSCRTGRGMYCLLMHFPFTIRHLTWRMGCAVPQLAFFPCVAMSQRIC